MSIDCTVFSNSFGGVTVILKIDSPAKCYVNSLRATVLENNVMLLGLPSSAHLQLKFHAQSFPSLFRRPRRRVSVVVGGGGLIGRGELFIVSLSVLVDNCSCWQ